MTKTDIIFVQIYVNKFENIDQVDNILGKCILPKQTLEGIENVTNSLNSKEDIENVVWLQPFPLSSISTGPNDFIGKFFQSYKANNSNST